MMLCDPFGRPGIEFDVVNESACFADCAGAKIAISRPIVSKKMVVVADALVNPLPQSCERANEEVDPGRVGMDKELVAVCVGGEAQDVFYWKICGSFWQSEGIDYRFPEQGETRKRRASVSYGWWRSPLCDSQPSGARRGIGPEAIVPPEREGLREPRAPSRSCSHDSPRRESAASRRIAAVRSSGVSHAPRQLSNSGKAGITPYILLTVWVWPNEALIGFRYSRS